MKHVDGADMIDKEKDMHLLLKSMSRCDRDPPPNPTWQKADFDLDPPKTLVGMICTMWQRL